MPNWATSTIKIKKNENTTLDKFINAVSLDGEYTSSLLMEFKDKEVVKDFQHASSLLDLTNHKYMIKYGLSIRKVMEQKIWNSETEREVSKYREKFIDIMEKNLKKLDIDINEKYGECFWENGEMVICTAFMATFNTVFGHDLEDVNLVKRALNWYNFNCEVLGTKWNFEVSNIYEDEKEIEIFCNTAWNPPREFCEKVSKMFNTTVLVIATEESCYGWTHKEDCGANEDEDWDTWECEETCYEHKSCDVYNNGLSILNTMLTNESNEEFAMDVYENSEPLESCDNCEENPAAYTSEFNGEDYCESCAENHFDEWLDGLNYEDAGLVEL